MIAWPTINGKRIGRVLRSSSWDTTPGFICDQTRSGKYKTRANHISAPDEFDITMHMTLPEYRVFNVWWKTVCRKGVYTFGYPKINDNTEVIVEYQFSDTKPNISNTSGDNLEITMRWMEAT
jgi:hypothetical protein